MTPKSERMTSKYQVVWKATIEASSAEAAAAAALEQLRTGTVTGLTVSSLRGAMLGAAQRFAVPTRADLEVLEAAD